MNSETLGWGFLIFVILASIGGLIYWTITSRKLTKKTDTSVDADTLIISNTGSKKETYVLSPSIDCASMKDEERPQWCSEYPGTEYLSYIYDGKNEYDLSGDGPRVFDRTTGECHNPTDCGIFKEYVDANQNLTAILSTDGRNLITEIGDDVYNGNIKVGAEIDRLQFNFETGALTDPLGESIIPGVTFPLGYYIMVVFVKYKNAGKPRPNIKFNLRANTANEFITAIRAENDARNANFRAAHQGKREAVVQRKRDAAGQRKLDAAVQRKREAAVQRKRDAAAQRKREAAASAGEEVVPAGAI